MALRSCCLLHSPSYPFRFCFSLLAKALVWPWELIQLNRNLPFIFFFKSVFQPQVSLDLHHSTALKCTTWVETGDRGLHQSKIHFKHLPLPHTLVQSSQMMPRLRINEQTSPVLVRKPRSGSKARSVPKPPDTKRNIIVDLISFEASPGVLHRGRPYLKHNKWALQSVSGRGDVVLRERTFLQQMGLTVLSCFLQRQLLEQWFIGLLCETQNNEHQRLGLFP